MKRILIFIVIISTTIFSTEIVKLKDGRKIIINDDYTWEEILNDSSNDTEKDHTNSLETKALFDRSPNLLLEDINGNVAIKVIETTKIKEEYEIKMSVRNKGNSNVIRVVGDIILLSDIGDTISIIEEVIYKGFNRVPDTYIRKNEVKTSAIRIKKIPNWNGRVRVTIKTIENR